MIQNKNAEEISISTENLLKNKVSELKLYPNPANNYFTLNYKTEQSENNIAKVMNVAGQIVDVINLENTDGEVLINTESYAAGIYSVTIWNGYRPLISKKLIISK